MINPMPPAEQFALYKSVERALEITDFSHRLIHYTHMSKLELILQSRELWFGRLCEMNDTAEVDHFLDGVVEALPNLFPEFSRDQLVQLAAAGRSPLRENTFVSSWCEHTNEEPDGVLSMWRAYAAGPDGVGIVVDSSKFQPSSLTPKNIGFFVNVSRIEYVRPGQAATLAKRFLGQLARVKEIAPFQRLLFAVALLAKAPCVKHNGFSEEKEVRFLTTGGMAAALKKILPIGPPPSELSLKRVGERLYAAIPLTNYPAFGFDLRVERLFKKVIVAPGPDIAERVASVRALLDAHNCQDVEVIGSSIPYRY